MTLAQVALAARRAPPWIPATTAACAVVFVALAILVVAGATDAIDRSTIVLFQSVASSLLDRVANAHTLVGQLVVTLALAAVLGGALRVRYGGHAWLAPALILATGAIELAFKLLVPHPSPPGEFVRAFEGANVLGIKGPPASFPSGHVARIAFLSVAMASLFPGRVSAALAVVFIAASVFLRVYIGDHWISDAVAGAALGIGLGAVAVAWIEATQGPAAPAGR